MTTRPAHTGRNATVLAATALTVGLLFLVPTSTNSSHRATTSAAPAGVVSPLAPSGAPAPTALVVNGTVADTRYGPVQVQIRVISGKVKAAKAIVYPRSSGTDRQINSYAIPALQAETLQAQSAHIDTVSGATYTSDGYQRSLQAALDAAHLHS